jgi:hypothetical protein
LLYVALQQASNPPSGLGHLDSRKDTLTITFELLPSSDTLLKRSKAKGKKRSEQNEKVIQVQLAQDKTALRSRKGDTGSVLWRARYVSIYSIFSLFSPQTAFEALNSLDLFYNNITVNWIVQFLTGPS